MSNGKVTKLDVRVIPPHERHPKRIFDIWDKLNVGDTLQIINDHDPKQLHYMFEAQYEDCYKWEYEAEGPKDWIINLTKTGGKDSSNSDLKNRVESALDEIRPNLQMDGGDVELVNIDEAQKSVSVRLVGACGTCPSAIFTLKAGIETAIREKVPEITEVISV